MPYLPDNRPPSLLNPESAPVYININLLRAVDSLQRECVCVLDGLSQEVLTLALVGRKAEIRRLKVFSTADKLRNLGF